MTTAQQIEKLMGRLADLVTQDGVCRWEVPSGVGNKTVGVLRQAKEMGCKVYPVDSSRPPYHWFAVEVHPERLNGGEACRRDPRMA